jgi:Fe-S cluster assembly iron-binding protein IscA
MLCTNDNNFKVELTEAAFAQIKLIKENDFTLEDHNFRIKIGGKGCDGFTYDTGFSTSDEEDKVISFKNKDNSKLNLLVDKFTYFYCKEGLIDYVLDPKINQDGFIFTNKNENIYSGKFFKEETLVPTEKDL